jgi:hypothetical protein
VPRFALVLGIASLACSLSIAGFFVGVPLGLLAVLLSWGPSVAEPGSRTRRLGQRSLVVGAMGLVAGLAVWFIHVRAAQTAYSIPTRDELHRGFDQAVGTMSAPLPGAPARANAAPPPGAQPAKDAR